MDEETFTIICKVRQLSIRTPGAHDITNSLNTVTEEYHTQSWMPFFLCKMKLFWTAENIFQLYPQSISVIDATRRN
jgi:hypothetical protein